jgi:hypothetical protein
MASLGNNIGWFVRSKAAPETTGNSRRQYNMPIPALDDDGFLPIGIHDCTLDELRASFGAFRQTDHRVKLFRKLREYILDLTSWGNVIAVYIDGSFVTAEIAPGDIDLIVVTPADFTMPAVMPPASYNALSSRMVRTKYGFDIALVPGSGGALSKWLDFFQKVKNVPGRRKGILKVTL